ncbi:hypothetical protein MGMO_141c00120 [Methyloglobulus morosus KoM1]|uniref:Uncharacterized protein n=1 Tax=Methyloglobulus morosus KoM1 TaxID=1116472 RepID=V5BM95_9GAMM|nr:hypothetical protein [Methyloglobulus morosus]ESS68929.1 hypothetical protein MGMO_141c00120 [Methyloglobulus morosus KoM1]
METSIPKKSLMAKARGFTVSIDKMHEKERGMTPSGEYGEDYNKLRELVLQQFINLKDLLPPVVETYYDANFKMKYSRKRYSEINTFCEQIFQLLSEEEG